MHCSVAPLSAAVLFTVGTAPITAQVATSPDSPVTFPKARRGATHRQTARLLRHG